MLQRQKPPPLPLALRFSRAVLYFAWVPSTIFFGLSLGLALVYPSTAAVTAVLINFITMATCVCLRIWIHPIK